MGAETPREVKRGGAIVVALGIFLSRCMGLIRERAFAYYFGNSAAADAFKAALRIPNILQNLFGEGALSASFIPVYSRLRSKGEVDRARLVAANVAAMLVVSTAIISALGIATSGVLVDVLAPGFAAEKRDLAVLLTQIFFPSVFLLVCSAWCLGVLNSHRRFFLPYASPVVWNVVIILGLVLLSRGRDEESLAIAAAWCVVIGSGAQFLIQVPLVWRLLGGIRLRLRPIVEESWDVVRNFGPVVLSRGVVQVSAYMDSVIASLLPTGSVAALSYAQNISLMPISLFSMSISAAELPGMSEIDGESESARDALKARLVSGLRRISFFIVPSAIALIALGDVIVRMLYETGRFGPDDTNRVWRILVASGMGLFCASLARLTAATFYALQDTKTPFRCSVVRVSSAIVLGLVAALGVPKWFALDPQWGLFGLSAASAIAGCIEYILLSNRLRARIGAYHVGVQQLVELWCVAALVALAVRWGVDSPATSLLGRVFGGALTLFAYGVLYVLILAARSNREARSLISGVRGKLSRFG